MRTNFSDQKWLLPVVGLIAFILMIFYPYDNRRVTRDNLLNSAYKNLPLESFLDTNIHSVKNVNDSLQKLLYWKRQRLTQYSQGFSHLFIGTALADDCDSCGYIDDAGHKTNYYVSIEGYAITAGATYYEDGNSRYIENRYSDGFNENRKTIISRKKINTRLVVTESPGQGVTVLIPVSQNAHSWISTVSLVFTSLAMLLGLYFFIVLPFRVLHNIANGKPFIKQNIKDLKQIGNAIICYCLALSAIPQIIRWMMSSSIPKEIFYPFWETLFDYRWVFFLGICVLITAKAFDKGYYLQEDKDLTY